MTGALSDRFGRKRLLVASALLFAGSSVLTGSAASFAWFVTWRITIGADGYAENAAAAVTLARSLVAVGRA